MIIVTDVEALLAMTIVLMLLANFVSCKSRVAWLLIGWIPVAIVIRFLQGLH